MKFRMTIGRKIWLGFGLFMGFALVVVVLTNRTLVRSRSINDKITKVYFPSVDALEQLRSLIVTSHMLIKHWALVESIPDAREKTILVELTEQELPRLLDRIDTLSGAWQPEEVSMLNGVFAEMDRVFDQQMEIRAMLPDLESYSDPLKYLERNDIAEEGGSLDEQFDRTLAELDVLIGQQETKRIRFRGDMIQSFDTLEFIILYAGISLIIIGLILAFFIVRGIVRPVHRLKTVLLSIGKGVLPKHNVHTTNDEIGEMTVALNDLVNGMKRTTEFSHAVAAGKFDAQYDPLSKDDVLGHALIQMRDELGQRERVLEEKVSLRTEELVRQKDEVEKQSRKIVELYNNLNDSIRYAKRLQDSILPPIEKMQELVPESFIFFRPRDIVSGDFYWFEEVGDRVIFAAVDCTGHGVPGAFMSLIGHNALNQVVKEKREVRPSEVLKEMNRIAYEALHKYRDGTLVRDGMDMALCSLDKRNGMLEFAGANCPLYLVRDNEVRRYNPDKIPIGGFELNGTTFTDHRIQLIPGDAVYIFSDGYADQFGGPKGKKFLYRRFRELLVNIKERPMHEQQQLLKETLVNWKGAHEQVDDILVIGMRA